MQQPKRRRNDGAATGVFCRRFGAVAVMKGFVTGEQVKTAMADQIDDDINGREHRLVGTILYDRGWLSEHQIERVLQEMKKTF